MDRSGHTLLLHPKHQQNEKETHQIAIQAKQVNG
jgi:hypothetical protein